MVNDGGMQIYIGGDETFKSHFDADRFGYFDLIDEIKQLGYAEWSRVAFTVPKSIKKIDIKDDNDVMLMLSYLDLGICVLDVYVVGGELGEAHVADSVGGEHADDGVNETHFEEVEGSVGGEHADDGVGKDEPEGEEDGPSLEKGGEGEDEQYEDWDEFDDGSYIPSTDRDNDTDYSSLDGFISEDDEHIEARDKFKKSNLRVITYDLFNGIVLNVGVNKTTEGCGDSDYVESDGDFVSDSTDKEDDRSRIKERHRRRVYDPRCYVYFETIFLIRENQAALVSLHRKSAHIQVQQHAQQHQQVAQQQHAQQQHAQVQQHAQHLQHARSQHKQQVTQNEEGQKQAHTQVKHNLAYQHKKARFK
ncbi:hypothetical protein SASPL_146948 [Salvia splendens]|uniref:PB1-like domain-containing protein n=1 Tax=Salvia splendens TaxID=180675 RepID=A0A8X8WEL9_SALSN|nr:hypothetical protein SASPL_146948 [Salvia splendens]